MKVKCIKKAIDDTNPRIANGYYQDWIELGAIYKVYGITISKEATYYMIFNEAHIVPVPIQKFEIVDHKAYRNWIINYDYVVKELNIWPELFYEKDFLENHSEWEDKEREQFRALMKEFEEDETNEL